MVGVAVMVTGVPVHTGLADGATVTLTGSNGLTVIVTGADVAGLPVGQTAFDVSTTVTTSPFNGIYA